MFRSAKSAFRKCLSSAFGLGGEEFVNLPGMRCAVTPLLGPRTPRKSILTSVNFGFNSSGAVSVESGQHGRTHLNVMAIEEEPSDDQVGLERRPPRRPADQALIKLAGL
ncbi:hypothetical protein KSP39_PZI010321 [Platanthera zijinensis]|uniref:Uncharacterized protein n=1 Tax=Platanthera zijinensis TaxID=2320716 RepID=A0AAP0BJG0_9ASPA